MRRHAVALFATALAGIATDARAIDVTASLGAGGAHSDAWGNGQHIVSNSWDYEGDIAISGSALRPGLFDWIVDANYRALRTMLYSGFDRDQAYGFDARASLLGGTPVPVSVSASRTWTDFLASDSNVSHTGETVIDNFGGTASVNVRGYPGLRFAFTHVDTTNVSLGGPSTTTGSDNLTVGFAHVLPNQAYQVDFATGWNQGTFTETNYHSDYLNASVEATPSDHIKLRITEHYYLRDPTVEAWNNPRYEDNSLGLGIQYRPDRRFTTSLDYTYHQLLVTVAGQPTIEDLNHSVGGSAYFRLTPRTSIYGTAAATYDHQEGSAGTYLNLGESCGAGFNWSGSAAGIAVSLGLGGTVGAIEAAVGGVTATYGGTVGAGAAWGHQSPGSVIQTNATYAGSYISGDTTGLGWKLDQRLLVGIDELDGGKVMMRHMLMASLTQQDGGQLGMMRSRSVSLSSSLGFRNYSLSFSTGASDSLGSSLAEPGASSGTLSPDPTGSLTSTTPNTIPLGQEFNTTTLFATLTLNEAFGRLRLIELARTLRTDAPGHEPQWERAVGLTALYELGAFVISLDDHYSVGGVGSDSQKSNLVMARITRTFGARLF